MSNWYQVWSVFNKVQGKPPIPRPSTELRNAEGVLEVIYKVNGITGVHDVGVGGLAVAVAEMAKGVGARVKLDEVPGRWERPYQALFSETGARYLIAVKEESVNEVLKLTGGKVIGEFGGSTLEFEYGNKRFEVPEFEELLEKGFERFVG